MIETLEGVANAEEIAATHGVDVVLIGNNDLSSFSGWSQNDPRYQDALIKVHDAALKYGKYFGNAGAQYLNGYVFSADTRMVQNGPARDGWTPPARGGGAGRGAGRGAPPAGRGRGDSVPEPDAGAGHRPARRRPPAVAVSTGRGVRVLDSDSIVRRRAACARAWRRWHWPRQSRSVWSGVYTDEQAAAGEKIYFDQVLDAATATNLGRRRAGAGAGRRAVSRVVARQGPAAAARSHRRRCRRASPRPLSSAEARRRAGVPPARVGDAERATALPADRAQLAEITFERARP